MIGPSTGPPSVPPVLWVAQEAGCWRLRVSGKTGSFLQLRHEIGVVETDASDRIAIAALTTSARRAAIAHDIDLDIGAAARAAFEAMRR